MWIFLDDLRNNQSAVKLEAILEIKWMLDSLVEKKKLNTVDLNDLLTIYSKVHDLTKEKQTKEEP